MKLNFPFSKKQEEVKETSEPETLTTPEKRRYQNIFSPSRNSQQPINETSYQPDQPSQSIPLGTKPVNKGQSKFGLKAITDFTHNLGKNISELLDLPEPTTNNIRRKSSTQDDQVDIFSASLLDVMKGIGSDISKGAMNIIPSKSTSTTTNGTTKSADSTPDSKLKSPSGRPRHASELLEMESIYAFDEELGDEDVTSFPDPTEITSLHHQQQSTTETSKPVKPVKPVKLTPQKKPFAVAAEQLHELLGSDEENEADTSSFAIQSGDLTTSPTSPPVTLPSFDDSEGEDDEEEEEEEEENEAQERLDHLASSSNPNASSLEIQAVTEESLEEEEEEEEEELEKNEFALPNDGFDDDDEYCV